MLIAVFGVLILLNRQTGGLFEEAFVYIFPLPMTAYSAKYGLRSGVPVFIGMVMITLFCGSFTAIAPAQQEELLAAAQPFRMKLTTKRQKKILHTNVRLQKTGWEL